MTDADHPSAPSDRGDLDRSSASPPVPTHIITIPTSFPMVTLLGPRDELLRTIERAFPLLDVHVRGNEISLRGVSSEVALVERLVDELLVIIDAGQPLNRDAVERSISMLRSQTRERPGRRAHDEHRQQPRPHDPAEDAEPEALRRRDRRAHHRLRDRAGRYRQDLPRDGQGRGRAAGEAGQPDHPDPPGRRGGGAARVPPGHPQRQDRPLPAAALRRPSRHGRPGLDPAADGRRDHRGRAPGVHARPDPERLVHHPRRGAEHLGRADEDVPHPARLRVEDGRHRRRHAGGPAGRHHVGAPPGPAHPRRRRRHPLLRADLRRRRPPPAGQRHRRRLRPVRRRPPRTPGGWARPADAAPATRFATSPERPPRERRGPQRDRVPRRRHRAGRALPLRHGRAEGPPAGRPLHHPRRRAGHGDPARAVDGPARPDRRHELPDGRAPPGPRGPGARGGHARRHRALPERRGQAGPGRRPRHRRGAAAPHHARHPAPARLRPRGAGRGARDVRAAAPAAPRPSSPAAAAPSTGPG